MQLTYNCPYNTYATYKRSLSNKASVKYRIVNYVIDLSTVSGARRLFSAAREGRPCNAQSAYRILLSARRVKREKKWERTVIIDHYRAEASGSFN